ncbi:MAG: ABC transporter substrate-binding protein [Rhizobiales bacterium]|nr:ABC transporter substrate-binding protein [Hyphomicrobiales bacterium]
MKLVKGTALAVGLLAAAASFVPQATAAESVSVRLKWVTQAQFAGIYVAKAKGFYEAAGLDVTINPGGPNLNPETLVASGADTFGIAGGTETMIFAAEKGLPIVAIGMSQEKTPFVFASFGDSGIKTIKDFAGKKVATFFEGAQYTLYTVLQHQGVEQSALQIIPQPFSLQPFIDKQFDVATLTTYNELLALREQGITDLNLFSPDDYGVTTQQDSIITSAAVIKDKPQVVQAFLDATLKGWKYALKNKSEAIDIVMAAGTGLDRKHQELMLDEIEKVMVANAGATMGLAALDMAAIGSVHDRLVSYKALKAPVDLKTVFDPSFWDKVPDEDKKM